CSLGSSHDAVDWRQIRPVECRLLAPHLESHRSRTREERLHAYRVQELETHPQAHLERLEFSTVGVQGNPALRRVQSQRICDVDDVNPAYTSRRCSHGKCGFTHEDNRDDDEFK
ncbi:MAG: hypothetical protein J07HQX50_00987, partial [Haloquadratum sp. J07HQX50]